MYEVNAMRYRGLREVSERQKWAKLEHEERQSSSEKKKMKEKKVEADIIHRGVIIT